MTLPNSSVTMPVHADYNGKASAELDKLTVDFNTGQVYLDVAETEQRHNVTTEFRVVNLLTPEEKAKSATQRYWSLASHTDPYTANMVFRVNEGDNRPDQIIIQSERHLQYAPEAGESPNSFDLVVYVKNETLPSNDVNTVARHEIYSYHDNDLSAPAEGVWTPLPARY